MDQQKLRAWWFERQGLSGSLEGDSPGQVLEKVGWARSVGGANPYLMLFNRANTSRDAADRAVANLEIHELPSARGCTYVVPKSHFGLALRLARGQGEPQDVGVAKRHLGVTDAELEKLQDAVLVSLKAGPKDPKEIRESAGGAVRSLGDEGKKRGMTTTLPLALGLLQTSGRIRRISTDGRLDNQRYRYALWEDPPKDAAGLTFEEACERFARLYFKWIGPATKSSFQQIAGIGVKAAEAAVSALDLIPIGDGRYFILREDQDGWEAFRPPEEPSYALASSLDGISHLHWGVAGLVEESDRERVVAGFTGQLGTLRDLESHAIYDRGRLLGFWEFDPGAGDIAWISWAPANSSLEKEIARMREFGRTQLGDIRSFSLDSPESRKPRIEALRGNAPAMA
jgi:hypothetical protein